MNSIESEILRNNLNYTLFEWRKQSGYKPLNIDKAEGVYLIDHQKNKILDFSSGLVNVNIGHGDQRVTDAVINQMKKVSYVNPSTITKVRGDLGKKLSEICPGNLNKSFFTICGATGIENAIKLGRVLIENGAVESGSDVITPFTDEEGESKEFNARYGDFINAIENLSCNCYKLEAFN